jgi:hypothetical protein
LSAEGDLDGVDWSFGEWVERSEGEDEDEDVWSNSAELGSPMEVDK